LRQVKAVVPDVYRALMTVPIARQMAAKLALACLAPRLSFIERQPWHGPLLCGWRFRSVSMSVREAIPGAVEVAGSSVAKLNV
jgi:hypothetical protein